jgi:hypothetical protein
MWWPRLEELISIQLNNTPEHVFGQARRNERDLLEEVLSLTRSLALNRSRDSLDSRHPAWQDLMASTARLATIVLAKSPDTETYTAIGRCVRTLQYIYQRIWDQDPSTHYRDVQEIIEVRELLKTFGIPDVGTAEPPPPPPPPPLVPG